MISNELRNGNFTSSQIYRLMGAKKPCETYIRSKQIEKRIGRSTDMAAYSKSMAWGELVEKRVFDLIENDYELCSQETLQHPEIKGWSGSPDCINKKLDIDADIKCYEPLNFANYADVLLQKNIEIFKDEFPKEYWQLVSNSCILGTKNAEAILYLPYVTELPIIADMAANWEDLSTQWRYKFISDSFLNDNLDALPYQIEGGYYSNLIRFVFEVPVEDKQALTEKVKQSIELL